MGYGGAGEGHLRSGGAVGKTDRRAAHMVAKAQHRGFLRETDGLQIQRRLTGQIAQQRSQQGGGAHCRLQGGGQISLGLNGHHRVRAALINHRAAAADL